MQNHLPFIKELVQNGGPEPSEYQLFNSWLQVINNEIMSGTISKNDWKTIRETFGRAISLVIFQWLYLVRSFFYLKTIDIIYEKDLKIDLLVPELIY